MLLAIDVHYKEKFARAVGVLFNWDDAEPVKVIIEHIEEVKDYVPGEFYKRELPCLLKVIKNVDLTILEAIIVDGYVFIDDTGGLGLGAVLYNSINQAVPVIGVAKTSFFRNKETVVEL